MVEHSWISFLPDILRPIEAILNESELLGFFGEEMENVASTLRQSAQMEDYQDSLESYFMKSIFSAKYPFLKCLHYAYILFLFDFFIGLNKNFHLILCLDATNSNVENYFEIYPALYSKTYMLYTQTESFDEQITMSRAYIQMLNELKLKTIVGIPSSQPNNNIDKSITKEIPICGQFNEIVKHIFDQESSPLKFYKMIKSYFHIYIKISDEIHQRLQKLQVKNPFIMLFLASFIIYYYYF